MTSPCPTRRGNPEGGGPPGGWVEKLGRSPPEPRARRGPTRQFPAKTLFDTEMSHEKQA